VLMSPSVILAVAALLGLAITLAIVLVTRRQRRCPSCGVHLVNIAHPGSRAADGTTITYEVLVCPSCTNALTLIAGSRQRYAWCPECRQRTLETPCIRLPDTAEGRRRVEVHEHCHLCGHMAVREIGDPALAPAKRGQVLQFPGPRRNKSKSGTDDR
jgi:hypothetical protein